MSLDKVTSLTLQQPTWIRKLKPKFLRMNPDNV